MIARLYILIGFSGVVICKWSSAQAEDCPRPPDSIDYSRITNNYAFIASSDQGAVGDVVGINISLRVDGPIPEHRLYGAVLVCCYDERHLELLEPVQYTAEFDELVFFGRFFYNEVSAIRPEAAHTRGFVQAANFQPDPVARLFSTIQQVPLMTAYFRLRGSAGETADVSFCDAVLGITINGPQSCERNLLLYQGETAFDEVNARSTLHMPGQVRILEGPPTRPNPPPVPPNAEVYPEAPTTESANIRFELSGAVVQPGAREIPLHVDVTSNYEFSGFSLSISFPVSRLEIARVEEHTRPGVVRIDNGEGFVGVVMTNSQRRVGAEGERVRIATLYVNLRESAADSGEVLLSFQARAPFLNWLAIH